MTPSATIVCAVLAFAAVATVLLHHSSSDSGGNARETKLFGSGPGPDDADAVGRFKASALAPAQRKEKAAATEIELKGTPAELKLLDELKGMFKELKESWQANVTHLSDSWGAKEKSMKEAWEATKERNKEAWEATKERNKEKMVRLKEASVGHMTKAKKMFQDKVLGMKAAWNAMTRTIMVRVKREKASWGCPHGENVTMSVFCGSLSHLWHALMAEPDWGSWHMTPAPQNDLVGE